jgi:membrane protein DedA with SNARE-associated domain
MTADIIILALTALLSSALGYLLGRLIGKAITL